MADFYTKTMLFVGISFADPNMQTLLRLVRLAEKPVTPQHYAIARRPDDDGSRETAALYALQKQDLRRGGVEYVEIEDYEDLPGLLRRAAIHARQPNVMLSGSLPEENLRLHLLRTLGVMLAALSPQVNLIHGGSRSLMPCVQSFAEHIERLRCYSEDRVVQIRRSVPSDSLSTSRIGMVAFPGSDRIAVREELCSRAAICIVIGGEDHTEEEVTECLRQGIRVVPIPVGSGYSQRLWETTVESRGDLEDQEVAALAGGDEAIAERTSSIVLQHLFG